MQIPAKHVATAKAFREFAKIFTSIRLSRMKLASPDTLPASVFAYGVPYEATETYRTTRSEFECNRSYAMLEARNALTRC